MTEFITQDEPDFMMHLFISDGEPYYPNIPVQTVSQTVATRLLRNISTTSLPSAWLPSVRRLLRKEDEAQNSTCMSVVLHYTVPTLKLFSDTISTVIGKITVFLRL